MNLYALADRARAAGRHVRARGLALAAVVVLVSACQPAGVLNAMLDESAYRLRGDLAYGSHPRQRLDLYEPASRPARDALVVFVYGGNWRRGDKHTYRFVAHALTALGYRVAVPDYRLYPDVTWPAFVDDVADALAWLTRADGPAAGAPLILVGHSAGAHTAALIATDPRYAERAGLAAPIASFVGLAGPYDLPFTEPVKPVFAPLEQPDPVKPLGHAPGRIPRALLLHGADDETVVPRHSRRFAEALEAAGVPVTLKVYEGVGHVALVAALAAPLRWLAPTHADVAAWLE